ncbi:MAG: UDP-N-acetylmuramate dehydrogenase [Longimicrobiales bacterium]|nr:UDP-N-acetylmuramate dehydrogenase [Longimicrobiales bacterium]
MTTTAHMDWKGALETRLGPDTIRVGVPLAPLTTFRIGGPADLFFRATTAEELVAVLTRTRELGIPTFLLGRGANILVGDGGFRGLVIQSAVGGIDFLDPQRVRAGAGVEIFPALIRATVERGLGGLHHFVGIPSSVGGAIWQNLHFLSPAPGRERTVFIEEFVESAEIFSEEGRREEVERDYFRFGYDYSILHDRSDAVLSVTFQLSPHPLPEMKRVMQENLQWRSDRHPDLLRYPSAGSIFKKVEGLGAGRLIDQCGLKGRIHGGAQIFEGHANIIVNLGGATAADVLALMVLAQETVYAETGRTLAPEITMVGEF